MRLKPTAFTIYYWSQQNNNKLVGMKTEKALDLEQLIMHKLSPSQKNKWFKIYDWENDTYTTRTQWNESIGLLSIDRV